MEPISEDQRQFILKTLLPYKDDKKKCSTILIDKIDGSGKRAKCVYLRRHNNPSKEKRCAVGQHMIPGPWQDNISDFEGLTKEYNPSEFFTKEAQDQNLDNYTWTMIQMYHDRLALDSSIGDIVYNLEEHTGVKFPELLLTKFN